MPAGAGPATAWAKVNLYLHVTGRREDGYHELDSLFVRTSVGDRLWISPAQEDRLEITGPFADRLAGEEARGNLVQRALDAMRRTEGHAGAFHVRLEKNLPVAAGLGGGSADAAATLKAMAALLGGPDDLFPLAGQLGSDVPPCLHELPILVSGVGETIAPAPRLPSAAMVLVNPGVPLATPSVFAARSGGFSRPDPLDRAPEDFDGLVAALARRRNDLEPPACRLEPLIAEVLAGLRLHEEIAFARMSGSGATCFGLAASLEEAERVARRMRASHPDWWVAATAMMTEVASLDRDKPINGRP